MADGASKDFFISYNHADSGWAEWIAWVLEEADYSTVIQAWDFRPGNNFVIEMDRAAQLAERLIAVLSPNYLGANFPQAEWAAAFATDPQGLKRRLIPVKVEECDPPGLLSQVAHINLVGMSGELAQSSLLAGLAPGRAKPETAPPFPGAGATSPTVPTAPQRSGGLDWKRLGSELATIWRTGDQTYRGNSRGPATLELHLIPVDDVIVESRALARMTDRLAEIGRTQGFFGPTQGLDPSQGESQVTVEARDSREEELAGLTVTRDGQVGGWLSLPRDMLGAIFDPNDVQARLARILKALSAVDGLTSERYGLAVGIDPISMMAVGDVSQVGHRSSTSMGFFDREAIRIPAEQSLSLSNLARTADIAEELTARLTARLGSR